MDHDVKKTGYTIAKFLILAFVYLFIVFETIQFVLPWLFSLNHSWWTSGHSMIVAACLIIILALLEFQLFKWIRIRLNQFLCKEETQNERRN